MTERSRGASALFPSLFLPPSTLVLPSFAKIHKCFTDFTINKTKYIYPKVLTRKKSLWRLQCTELAPPNKSITSRVESVQCARSTCIQSIVSGTRATCIQPIVCGTRATFHVYGRDTCHVPRLWCLYCTIDIL